MLIALKVNTGTALASSPEMSSADVLSIVNEHLLRHGYKSLPPLHPPPPPQTPHCGSLVPVEWPVPEMDTAWRRPAVAADDLCGAGAPVSGLSLISFPGRLGRERAPHRPDISTIWTPFKTLLSTARQLHISRQCS